MRLTENQVIEGLTKRGVAPHTAQGVAMNFKDESGLESGIQEHSPTSGRGGFGFAQWTGPRRVNLENYAASKGVAVDDPEMQLDFFMEENAGPEANAWAKVTAATDHKQAAAAFVTHWERPAEEHRASRTAKYLNGAADYSAGVEMPDFQPTEAVAGVSRVAAPEAPSTWQLQKDAFNQESTVAYLMNSNPYKDDPTYQKPTEEAMLADLKNANLDPEHYAKFLAGSTSQAGYQKLLADAQLDRDRVGRLSQAGLKGVGLQIVNQFLDPVQLAADIAVSAVAPQLVFGKRLGRVSKTLIGAVGGAAGGLAGSAANYAVNPNATKADLMMGTVFGFGVGAVVGKLASRGATAVEGRQLQQLAQREIDAHEGFHPPMAGSVGAARLNIAEPRLNPDGSLAGLTNADIAPTAFRSARADLSATYDKSPNVLTRAMGGALVQDGVGKVGNAVNGRAASEEMENFAQEFSANYHRTYKAQLQEHYKLQGTGQVDKRFLGNEERNFNNLIHQYVTDKKGGRADRYSKPVQVAGDKFASQMAELNKLQKNPWLREGTEGRSVFGHENIPDNQHYAPRELQHDKIYAIDNTMEKGTLEELFYGAARSENPDIPDAALRAFAKGYTKAISNRAVGLNDDLVRSLSGDDVDEMAHILKEFGGLDDKAAYEIAENFRKPKAGSDAGRDTNQRRRATFDEHYKLPYNPKRLDGTVDDHGLSIRDVVNTDATALHTRYARRAAGNIALARIRVLDKEGKLAVDGITSDAEWAKYLESVTKKAADDGVDTKQTKKDIKNLQFAYDAIKGRAVDDMEGTTTGFALRMIRKFNFSRIMNQAGFAAIPEVGNIVGSAGLKAALSQMPGVRRIMSLDGETILRDGLSDDIEATFGIGTERLTRYHSNDRIDELADSIGNDSSMGWRDHIENVLERANHVTSDTSGMSFINVTTQRWATKAMIQQFANVAAGRSKMSIKRLADLGLDPAMASRVYKELNENIVKRSGNKVVGLNLDKAVDKEAAEAFRRAISRKVSQVIQKNDIGNLMPFMSKSIGKVMMQFRSFMVASYVKQSMKHLHMRDPEAGISMAITSAIAALTYTMQMKLQAIGRSDAEEFLYDEKRGRLTTSNIAKAAFAKAGWSSIIPTLVDTMSATGLYDSQFSYTRTTGQASDVLFGNPTAGLINDTFKAFKGASGAAQSDGDWSQEEARALPRVALFGNALPLLTGYNAMISDLPERAPRERK